MIKVDRCNQNPLITPQDVRPSREDFKVDGIFNCGVTRYKDEIILLCRVAESVKNVPEGSYKIPLVTNKHGKDEIEVVTIVQSEHPEFDYSDSRSIWRKDAKGMKKIAYLTSLSHLRIARSKDGIHFTVDDKPTILPRAEDECWGMEDPRITKIEDNYYINYTSVTRHGAATSLLVTRDFITFERKGVIFAPENKDVTIFPEKINGSYVAFNRPVPCSIGYPDMWIAKSPDLIHWGEQRHFSGVTTDGWENGRIGGGAVPFKTEKGWIKIYHGADQENRYCLGAFLLDKDDPAKIIARTKDPILKPETDYEKEGFFENVVFTCGCLFENDIVSIYYGAADDKICRADIHIREIYKALQIM